MCIRDRKTVVRQTSLGGRMGRSPSKVLQKSPFCAPGHDIPVTAPHRGLLRPTASGTGRRQLRALRLQKPFESPYGSLRRRRPGASFRITQLIRSTRPHGVQCVSPSFQATGLHRAGNGAPLQTKRRNGHRDCARRPPADTSRTPPRLLPLHNRHTRVAPAPMPKVGPATPW